MAFLVAKAVSCRHTGFYKVLNSQVRPSDLFFVLSSSCHPSCKVPLQRHLYCALSPYTNRPMYFLRHGDNVSGRLRVLFLHPYAYQCILTNTSRSTTVSPVLWKRIYGLCFLHPTF